MNELADLSLETLAPELRLLTSLLAADHEPTALERHLSEYSPDDIDWPLFLKYVRHHRVHASVYNILKCMKADWLPEEALAALQREYAANTFKMLHLSGEMERVCNELHTQAIRTVVLKGPILASLLYGDLSMRSSKDLDILVSLDDLERAEAALRDLGYELQIDVPRIFRDWKWKAHHITYLHAQKGVQVELHWRMNRDLNSEPSFDELWARKRQYAGNIAILGEEDLFLHLINHGARHGWFRLRWLLDIDRLIRMTTSWESLFPHIRQYQCRHMIGQAMILVSHLLKTPIPEALQPFMLSTHAKRIAVKSMAFIRDQVNLHKNTAPHVLKEFNAYLLSLKTTQGLLKYCLHRLYPNSWDSRVIKLPRTLFFLYVPLRPFLWIWQRMNRYH